MRITDHLPDSVVFLSASDGCTEADGRVTCDVGDLDEGQSAQREIVVRPRRLDQIVNAASVAGAESDPVGGNNSARERTSVIPSKPRFCGRQRVTIFGSRGDDTLVGTARRDVIQAGLGNDSVRGRGGDDVICGGGGADVLRGGPGNDRVLGNRGPDSLFGNRGRDTLNGGPGVDACKGGSGGDTIRKCEG